MSSQSPSPGDNETLTSSRVTVPSSSISRYLNNASLSSRLASMSKACNIPNRSVFLMAAFSARVSSQSSFADVARSSDS